MTDGLMVRRFDRSRWIMQISEDFPPAAQVMAPLITLTRAVAAGAISSVSPHETAQTRPVQRTS